MIIVISNETPAEKIVTVSDVVIVKDGNFAKVIKDRHGITFGQSTPFGKLDEFIISNFM